MFSTAFIILVLVLTPQLRPQKCGECGDEFLWDADAGSAVCIGCGTLQDSAQVVLDAHIEPEENARDRHTLSFFSRSNLATSKNSQGWYIAGHGNLAAAERKAVSGFNATVVTSLE